LTTNMQTHSLPRRTGEGRKKSKGANNNMRGGTDPFPPVLECGVGVRGRFWGAEKKKDWG